MKTTVLLTSWGAALMLGLCAGCTHVYRPPATVVTGYAPQEKIPARVELRLPPELWTAEWKQELMGDTFVIPVGTNLCKNAEELARHLFSEVTVMSDSKNLPHQSTQAILTPRLVAFEQARGVAAGSEATTTIILEWSVKDLQNQLLWIDTLKGQASGKQGSAFSMGRRTEERVRGMLHELFQRSFQALASAPEIRRLSTSSRISAQPSENKK